MSQVTIVRLQARQLCTLPNLREKPQFAILSIAVKLIWGRDCLVSDLDQAKPPNGVRSLVANFSIVIATRRCPPAILCPTVYRVPVSTLFGLNSHVS